MSDKRFAYRVSLSSASHSIPSEYSRCVVGTTSVGYRISTGNIVSLFGCSLSEGIASLKPRLLNRFALRCFAPNTIRLSSVRRTLSSRRFKQCAVRRKCFTRSTLSTLYPPLYSHHPPLSILYSPPSTLHSSFFTLNFSLRRRAGSIDKKRRLAFSILPIGRFVSYSLPVMPELMII